MFRIRDEMQADLGISDHEGQSAEEAYASRLQSLSLTEGEIQDGRDVVKALLVRCTFWLEIMREKYDGLLYH